MSKLTLNGLRRKLGKKNFEALMSTRTAMRRHFTGQIEYFARYYVTPTELATVEWRVRWDNEAGEYAAQVVCTYTANLHHSCAGENTPIVPDSSQVGGV